MPERFFPFLCLGRPSGEGDEDWMTGVWGFVSALVSRVVGGGESTDESTDKLHPIPSDPEKERSPPAIMSPTTLPPLPAIEPPVKVVSPPLETPPLESPPLESPQVESTKEIFVRVSHRGRIARRNRKRVPESNAKPPKKPTLPFPRERPPLTEEEKAVAEAVVGFATKQLATASKSTFGGSLNRILRREHPAIYLEDIPLDDKFAETFHAKFNKEYLDAIVSRSAVKDHREGDCGNGRCVLNRLSRTSREDLNACIKEALS